MSSVKLSLLNAVRTCWNCLLGIFLGDIDVASIASGVQMPTLHSELSNVNMWNSILLVNNICMKLQCFMSNCLSKCCRINCNHLMVVFLLTGNISVKTNSWLKTVPVSRELVMLGCDSVLCCSTMPAWNCQWDHQIFIAKCCMNKLRTFAGCFVCQQW